MGLAKRLVITLTATVCAGAVGMTATAHAEQSSNVQAIASIPLLPTAISINFIGDDMFVSTATGVYAYDVSKPEAPRLRSALPMFIWENEDVDVDPVRKLLFVSRDPRGFTTPATPGSLFPYGAVQVIDVSNPDLMTLQKTFLLEAGHTTTCINHCEFLWTAGPGTSTLTQPGEWTGRPVFGTDFRDPANPKACPDPIDTGRDDGVTAYAHDVQVDALGIAWISGQGGVRGYWTSGTHKDPVTGETRQATGCKPIPYGGSGTPEAATPSRFMHNSWRDYKQPTTRTVSKRVCSTVVRRSKKGKKLRRKVCRTRKVAQTVVSPSNDVLLATEENVVSDCPTAGRFVTYDLRGTYDGEGFKDTAKTKHRMKALGTWTPEKQAGSSGCASSHYFQSRGDGITVNAFYEQGVRFLDVSDPRDIRQVGYFRESNSNTWAAYWHGGYVYVADFGRGVDVLKFTGSTGSPTVRATALKAAPRSKLEFSADVFGGLCPLKVGVKV